MKEPDMDELVKLVAQKSGITSDQAKTAVETVLAYLKQNLPAPVAAQVDAVLSGKAPDVGSLTSGLGGMFGH
jgi:hypothetical protein